MDQFDLSGFFTTKSQAADFSTRLAGVAEKMFNTGFELESALHKHLGIQKKEKFISLLRNNNIPLDSNEKIKSCIQSILEQIKLLPILTLTIAFEPDESTLRTLSEWFIINIKKQVLLDIVIDPHLVAGAVISINGKFFDFSIKPKLKDILDGVVAKTFLPSSVRSNRIKPKS